MADTKTQIGQYRPAARLKEGWHLKHNETWTEIVSVVQILSPIKFAMLKLANGFEVDVPHTHEVFTRTAAEIKLAEAGGDRG